MAKETIDSWEKITYFELTFVQDFGVKVSKVEMHTILTKKPLGENKKNDKLVYDNISMKVDDMEYIK